MKRVISAIMICLMTVFVFPIEVLNAEEQELVVEDIVLSKGQVFKGDEFNLGLTLRNKDKSNDIKDVVININERGSFYTKNQSSQKTIGKISRDSNATMEPYTLIYDGGKDSKLGLNIKYTINGKTKEFSFYVNVNVVPGDDESGNVGDSSKYKPKFVLQDQAMPSVKSGDTFTLNLKLSNVTNYRAKYLEVTSMLAESQIFELAEISPTKSVTQVNGNSYATIQYKLRVKSNAASGTYPIQFNYSYENDYKDKWKDESFTTYVKVTGESSNVTTDVSIQKDSSNKTSVVAGADFVYKFNLVNKGSTITNAVLTLMELDGEKIMNTSSNSMSIGTVNSGSTKQVAFNLNANDSLKTGNYPIKAQLTFKDGAGKPQTIDQTYYMRVEQNNSDITISGIKSTASAVAENGRFTLTVPVKNTGKSALTNLKVSAIPTEANIIPVGEYIKYVDLKAGETKVVTFSYTVGRGSTAGSKTIKISAENSKVKSEYEYAIYADIKEKKEETPNVNSSKPIIIIDKYIVEPKIVRAGQEFDMNLEFQNTHKNKTVENIKIMIKAIEKEGKESEDVFAPVNGSTTFYIDSISPKSTANISTKMFTIPDAKSKTYKLAVNIEYEYKEGNEIKSATVADEVGVTVRQNSKFMTSDLSLPESTQAGMPLYISMQISNTGKIDLSNFMVELEGDFHTESKKTFMGNIAAGATQSYDVEITPMTPGMQNGALIFSYEEPTGEIVTERHEFSINVEEAFIPPTDEGVPPIDGGMEDPLGQKNNVIKYGVIGAVIIVAVVGGVVFYKKRKNKKAMEEEDIDE